jgi:hypothetical protein
MGFIKHRRRAENGSEPAVTRVRKNVNFFSFCVVVFYFMANKLR